jgi:beta-galactosidase
MGHVFRHVRALKRLGCPVDVVGEAADFTQYPFLVAPAYQLVDEALVRRWTEYAERGGHLVLTCRTGHKDRRGFLWEGPWAAPILDLIGAEVTLYDVLPAPRGGRVEAGGETFRWNAWAEVLAPRPATETLARHAGQFYAGGVAAVTRSLGTGTVTYIGVDSRNGDLEARLLREVFRRAGVPVEDYDEGFAVDWRDGFWVATNFTERTQAAPAPPDAELLIGTREVPPAGVAVWREG